MATTDPQTLTAYTTQALKSLEGATDPSALPDLTKELYVRAREYPTFREVFQREDVRQAVGEALVKNNAEGLKTILIGVFTQIAQEDRPKQAEETPGPDPFISQESYASVVKLEPGVRVARLKEVEEMSQAYLDRKKSAQRRSFAQRLTGNFVRQSRAQITEEQKRLEAERIEKALSLEWYRSQAEVRATIEQSPYKGMVSDRVIQQIAADSEKITRTVRASQERVERALVAAATSIADTDEAVVYKPGVFLEIAADQAERSNAPVAQIITRAAALERSTEGFTNRAQALPQNLSLLAETPLQKLVAGVIGALPEGPRGAIIAGVVGEAWERAVDAATRHYGQQVVNEDWFQRAITSGNKSFPDKKSAFQSLTSGAQKVLGDVAGSVFRGPMDEATVAYLETVRLHITVAVPVTYQQFYTAAVYSHNPGIFSYGANLGLQYGAKKIARKAIQSGAGKVAAGAAGKALTGIATGGTGLLVSLGLDALGSLFKKGVGFFKNLVGAGDTKISSDKWLLIGAACFVLVFFLPILPLFNLPAFNQSMIDTSLANSIGGGMEFGPIINCQLTPDDPQCKFTACVGDCRWPASGTITQGPRTAAYCAVRTSHASGSAANGIDIASFGGPVYTPRAGTVVATYTGCGNNTGKRGDRCGGSPAYAGYGNHVILKTDDGYTLIFAHLESAVGVQAGQHIPAGTQLGWMDQTGSSTGTHLHFGVLSGGNVLDFVPPGSPSPESIDGCVSNTQGCTKGCPTTPVTAGI